MSKYSGLLYFIMGSDSQTILAMKLNSILGIDFQKNANLIESVSINNFAQGQTIFSQGEIANSCFLVISGNVKIVSKYNGIESILTVISKGELGGALLMEKPEAVYPGSVVAMNPTCLLLIPRNTFMNHWTTHPEALRLAISCIRSRMQHLQEDKQLQLFDVESRVINFLHRHYIERKDLVLKKITRKEIAMVVGSKTETVIRVFKKLEQAGKVKTNRSIITILDKSWLEQKIKNGK